jgi:hypothetical protein
MQVEFSDGTPISAVLDGDEIETVTATLRESLMAIERAGVQQPRDPDDLRERRARILGLLDQLNP